MFFLRANISFCILGLNDLTIHEHFIQRIYTERVSSHYGSFTVDVPQKHGKKVNHKIQNFSLQ